MKRMKTKEKIIDPEKENAKAEAQRIMESIVTQNRIAKELFRYETLKRSVKKMNYFSNKLRYLLHKR